MRYATAAPGTLVQHPDNWRIHTELQQRALEGVLDEVGWVQAIVVNQRSGRLVDGHLRLTASLRRGEKSVPVLFVDLSDEEERLVLATLDPIGALAQTESAKLESIVEGLEITSDAVDKMLFALLDDSMAATLKPEDEDKPSGQQSLGKSGVVEVKPVFAVEQIADFEKALQKTGLRNRAEALIAICRHYLDAEGQHNIRPKSAAA